MARILVTGTDGYIGTMLGPYLLEQGHEVVGLDTGFYRDGWLYHSYRRAMPATLDKDIRQIKVDDLQGFDAVVHLAELSNDPLAHFRRANTYNINHIGSVELARKCKKAGVVRFVYTSSCSVYGAGAEGLKTEDSEPNPQTAYAECKALVERDVGDLSDDDFSPTFLRNATAYGASPRMRFDIVLNNLAGLAWTTKEIKMTSDGSPWRPLVHVLDICKAIACTLKASRKIIHNQIFNVGDSKQNYLVKEIAETVAEVFPGCTLNFGKADGDNRSYRVSFDKIHARLPDFSCEYDARCGAEQLREVFEQLKLTSDIFESRSYTRLKQLRYLIETEQLDEELFWRHPRFEQGKFNVNRFSEKQL